MCKYINIHVNKMMFTHINKKGGKLLDACKKQNKKKTLTLIK